MWRDIPEALAAQYHTIVVDLIGFGGSEKPHCDYTLSFFIQFLNEFIVQLGITNEEKIVLVGHSLGGFISIEFAIKNRDRIKKIVLFDSSGLLKTPTPLLYDFLDAVRTDDPDLRKVKLVKLFESLLAHPSRLLPVVVDIFVSVIDSQGAKESFESAFRNSTSNIIDSTQVSKLRDIPILIFWGEKDKLIPLNFLDKFKELLPNADTIIIKDAGHSPFVEKPAIVFQVMLNFLS